MSKLLYGAEIWAESLDKYKTVREKIKRAQTGVVKSSIRACKTVSGNAALIIAGMLPADLMAEERRDIYQNQTNKKEAREKTRAKWAREIVKYRAAKWTKALIKDPLKWMDRKHGELSYEMRVQLLSGNGCFGTFRKKIGKSNSAKCWNCDGHILTCKKWEESRKKMTKQIETDPVFGLSKHNLVEKMLESEKKWNLIAEWVRVVMRAKAGEEREKEVNGRYD